MVTSDLNVQIHKDAHLPVHTCEHTPPHNKQMKTALEPTTIFFFKEKFKIVESLRYCKFQRDFVSRFFKLLCISLYL